jgi:hypothetical protein
METDNRFVAFLNTTNNATKRANHLSEYNINRNVNAFTGEYYESDKFAFLTLEENSSKQFGNDTVFLGFQNTLVSIYDKWGGAENFRRVTGGIG